MTRPLDRPCPYLRALSWGLHALAPHEVYVPMNAARAHLAALDPAMSGAGVAPAAVDEASGLPAFSWMERVEAEATLARRGSAETDVRDEALARARRMDPALASRMEQRRALHRHLRTFPVLPMSALTVVVRQLHPRTVFSIRYDRVAPMGGWMCVLADLTGGKGWTGDNLFQVQSDDTVTAVVGLQHLFSRHVLTPLVALFDQVQAATAAEITRITRTFVGPFWFPGGPVPDDAPEAARGALVLHLSQALLSREITASHHRDAWSPPVVGERLPDGFGMFRERRFAATPTRVEALKDWSRDRGVDSVVVPIRPIRGA